MCEEIGVGKVVTDSGDVLGKLFEDAAVQQDVIDEMLASVVSPDKVAEYVADQIIFCSGLKDAVEVRLRRSAVGGAQWQRLGAVGIAVQVVHKAQRLVYQIQPAEEVLSIPRDDREKLMEIKNNAIDVSVYGLMLAGKISEMLGETT